MIDLVFEADDELPIGIEDDSAITTKILTMVDVAYCCWKNDGSELELPDTNQAVKPTKAKPSTPADAERQLKSFIAKFDPALVRLRHRAGTS